MPRFTIPVNEKKERQKKLFAWIYVVMTVCCIIGIIVFGREGRLLRIANMVILVCSINSLRAIIISLRGITKVRFVDVNENNIGWFVRERSDTRIFIEWNDIRWIKSENNGSISIFRDSSFSNNLNIADFSEEDKEGILSLLKHYAIQKQIRLVNFSEVSVALA
jgi:hypothetical protein